MTKKILLLGAVWMLSLLAFGQQSRIYGSVAVSGYDPVAYFTEGKPVKGGATNSLEYMGAEWRFSSEENKALFLADPEKYAPQYGGYCAWAVANNYTAPGNPKDWTIRDGKLYLNFNSNIHRQWLRNVERYIQRGDRNWPGVVDR